MTGARPGGLPTQGEQLAQAFAAQGYPVILTSGRPNRYIRLLDIAWTLFAHRKDIDIQILQVYSGPSFLLAEVASWIAKRTGQRLVMVTHGGNLPAFARRHPGWVKRVFTQADRIIAPSSYLKNELAWLGYDIDVIPNMLELSHYPFQPRARLKPHILWMRAFHEIYNPELALRVFARLIEEFPQGRLTMAGPDKGLLKATRRLAEERGLAGRVDFPGFLDLQAKLAAGRKHDIYLNTNEIDNTPVSVLEMAAMGLPIVATTVGGIPYMLTDGENALLTPADDDLAMAEAVRRLLTDPQLAAKLSCAGRALAEGYAWENVRHRWETVFREMFAF